MKTSEATKEELVFVVSKDTACNRCASPITSGDFIKPITLPDGVKQGICMTCAGYDDYDYLSAGNAKLTRLASKYSSSRTVVLRWSRSRKRYERRGLLLERSALNRAVDELGLNETKTEAT